VTVWLNDDGRRERTARRRGAENGCERFQNLT
jgi:hypothetical protein